MSRNFSGPSYGIIVVVYAQEDAAPGAIIERSLNGVTGWEEVGYLPSVLRIGDAFVDNLPNDGITRFYRARHVWESGEPGSYTNTVAGAPILINPNLNLDARPWPTEVPLNTAIFVDVSGSVEIFADGSYRTRSVRWALTTASLALPDVENGTVYNLTGSIDPTSSAAITSTNPEGLLGITTIGTNFTASDGDIIRTGVQFFTETDAGGRLLGTHYEVTRYIFEPGLDGLVPIFSIDGPVSFQSSSAGITPATATSITGSLVRSGIKEEEIFLTIGPSGGSLVGNVISSTSANISSSFTSNTSGPTLDVTLTMFSGSGVSALPVLSQTFLIVTDGGQGVDGAPGPGIVYRGDYSATETYYSSSVRRDVVSSGGTYYLSNVNNTTATAPPSADWDSFGAQFDSVATDILFAQDVYSNRTINIGSSGSNPVIALNADHPTGANPFMSLGQPTQGYNKKGIFLGYDSGTEKLSLSGSSGFMRWDGSALTLSGRLEAGSVNIGDNVDGSNYNGMQLDSNNYFKSGSGITKFRVGDSSNFIDFDSSTGLITLNGLLTGSGGAQIKGVDVEFGDSSFTRIFIENPLDTTQFGDWNFTSTGTGTGYSDLYVGTNATNWASTGDNGSSLRVAGDGIFKGDVTVNGTLSATTLAASSVDITEQITGLGALPIVVAGGVGSSQTLYADSTTTSPTYNANSSTLDLTGGTIIASTIGASGTTTLAGTLGTNISRGSTTVITNLNADLLDGNHASAFYLASNPNGYTTNTGTVTSVSTGTGLTGGPVTTTGTISHADTSALNGTYGGNGISDITVDSLGHVTNIGTATYVESNSSPTFTDVYVGGHIYHSGDTDTYLRFVGEDDFQLVVGNRQMIRIDEGVDPDVIQFGDTATTTKVVTTGSMYVGQEALTSIGTLANEKLNVNGDIFMPTGSSLWIGSATDSGSRARVHQFTHNMYLDWGSGSLYLRSGAGSAVERARLDSTGIFVATTDVQVSSDIRLKNVSDIPVVGLDIVNNITPIKYTWKDNRDNDKLHLGFAAQELLDIVPEVVGEHEGYYSVAYQKLVPVLVKAIQELTKEVEELKKKIGD